MAVLKEVKLTLRLAPDMELEASGKACAIAQAMKMSQDKIDEVRMAVVEACINAIEHSAAVDQTLHLTFTVLGQREPEVLRITVRDFGIGFDRENLVQPNIEEKLKAESKRGWGLKIIEGLMDEVDVVSGSRGTSVVMSKVR
jgi:serine/threonine-protein kinase RsbW